MEKLREAVALVASIDAAGGPVEGSLEAIEYQEAKLLIAKFQALLAK